MESYYVRKYLSVLVLFTTICLSAFATNSDKTAQMQATSTFAGVEVLNGIQCNGGSNAVAHVYIFAGQPPYTYLWSTGDTTSIVEGLSAGFYQVIVTDNTLATDTLDLIIEEPPAIEISFNQFGTDSLEAIIYGGIPPYDIQWSTGDVTAQIGNVQYGVYEITVTDANGCLKTALYEIVQPNPGWITFPTNYTHKIIVHASPDHIVNGKPLEPGDYIGVFYDSAYTGSLSSCGGFIEWTGFTDTLFAYGDDPQSTTVVEGFNVGDEFVWKIWDESEEEAFKANVDYSTNFPNSSYWDSNGFSGVMWLQGYAEHFVELAEGWGIMSTFIDPFEADANLVFAELYQNVILIKDEWGEIFFPSWNLNLIGPLVIGEGYQIKMNTQGGLKSTFTLYVNGIRVDPDEPIELRPGWNIISFLHTEPYDIEIMLQSILPYVEIVKDEAGNVYIPDGMPGGPINQIQEMAPGKGYKIKILSGNNVILEYPDPPPGTKSGTGNIPVKTTHYPHCINTGNNHTVIIPAGSLPLKPEKGDEMAIILNNNVVGSAAYFDEKFIIAVFGDDETTSQKDGPIEGDALKFKYWNKSENKEQILSVQHWALGDGIYEIDKLSIADEIKVTTDDEQINMFIHPNPNNGKFTLFLENCTKEINIEISDALGQIIYTKSGYPTTKKWIDLNKIPSGVYFIKVKHGEQILLKKVIIQ